MPAIRSGLLIAASLFAALSPASARILKTRPSPSKTWSPLAPLVIGGGVEFETNREQSQYDFPLLFEYNFTETFKMTLEPNFVSIIGKAPDVNSVSGLGDLETSVEYEFLRERRYRPALTALGVIKWPTASHPDLGNPGRDYSLGLIASKDFIFMDVDLSALYTWVGNPEERNALEISLAASWHLNRYLDLEAEVLHTIGTGGIRGQPGTISGAGGLGKGGANQTEGTVGLAWHVNKHLKLEPGFILKSDHSWQVVFAWEWSFGGTD